MKPLFYFEWLNAERRALTPSRDEIVVQDVTALEKCKRWSKFGNSCGNGDSARGHEQTNSEFNHPLTTTMTDRVASTVETGAESALVAHHRSLV
jgi:hypothetical protein